MLCGRRTLEGYAYQQPIYENDQLTTVSLTGKPGTNFQAGADHTVRSFYSGVADVSPSGLGSDRTLPFNKAQPKFAYSLTRDQNGNEGMEWKDGFGRVVQTGRVVSGPGGQDRVVVEKNVYDNRGNLKTKHPPISCKNLDGSDSNLPNCVSPTEYEYDSQNRLVEENHPDAGITRYFFDKAGLQRMSQTSAQRLEKRFSVSVFDDLGRVSYSGEYRDVGNLMPSRNAAQAKAEEKTWPLQSDPNLELTSKYYYDAMPSAQPPELNAYNTSTGKNVRLYDDFDAGRFQYTRGRLCAVITFQKPIEGIGEAETALMEPFFTTAYRYDKYGRIEQILTYNGFLTDPVYKLQSSTNVYDAGGRLNQVMNYDRWPGSNPSKNTFISYDNSGRMKEIMSDGGRILASYTYYATTNQVKTLFLNKDEEHSARVDYLYHISGALKSMDAVRISGSSTQPIYAQELFFDLLPSGLGGTPQYNGNIAASEYSFTDRVNGVRSAAYSYDKAGRLLNSLYQLDDGLTNGDDDRFDEAIAYDDNGKILSMRRGAKAALPTGGEYSYKDKKSQLVAVAPGMDGQAHPRNLSGSQSQPKFEYDANGRMVADYSKGLVVSYDHRDLPLEFSYSTATARFRVLHRYDYAGNRIAKLLIAQGGSIGFDGILVDADASRSRDYPALGVALRDLELKVAALSQAPPPIQIHVVPDVEGFVDVGGMDEVTALSYSGEQAGLDLVGIQAGTPEYLALLEERTEGQSLVNSMHYTQAGNEIRQEFDVAGTTTKVLTNLPGGIGRYNPDRSRLYFLKNHLGSTVVSFLESDGGLSDIYDYHPYGLETKLMTGSSDKITETFTGKELDGEERRLSQETAFAGFLYFGARYYDPDIGVWISPDAARQFHTPYAYDPNPINRVDPGGNQSVEAMFRWAFNFTGSNNIAIQPVQAEGWDISRSKSEAGVSVQLYRLKVWESGEYVSMQDSKSISTIQYCLFCGDAGFSLSAKDGVSASLNFHLVEKSVKTTSLETGDYSAGSFNIGAGAEGTLSGRKVKGGATLGGGGTLEAGQGEPLEF